MIRIISTAVLITAVALLVSCAAHPSPSTAVDSTGPRIAEGTIVQISSGHGNAYTSIGPDQYEPLGLEPGRRIHVAFGDTAMTLVLGRTYTDVPSGTPLAVLHREGLTFAICDGNFSATYGIAIGTPFVIAAVDGKAAPAH